MKKTLRFGLRVIGLAAYAATICSAVGGYAQTSAVIKPTAQNPSFALLHIPDLKEPITFYYTMSIQDMSTPQRRQANLNYSRNSQKLDQLFNSDPNSVTKAIAEKILTSKPDSEPISPAMPTKTYDAVLSEKGHTLYFDVVPQSNTIVPGSTIHLVDEAVGVHLIQNQLAYTVFKDRHESNIYVLSPMDRFQGNFDVLYYGSNLELPIPGANMRILPWVNNTHAASGNPLTLDGSLVNDYRSPDYPIGSDTAVITFREIQGKYYPVHAVEPEGVSSQDTHLIAFSWDFSHYTLFNHQMLPGVTSITNYQRVASADGTAESVPLERWTYHLWKVVPQYLPSKDYQPFHYIQSDLTQVGLFKPGVGTHFFYYNPAWGTLEQQAQRAAWRDAMEQKMIKQGNLHGDPKTGIYVLAALLCIGAIWLWQRRRRQLQN